MTFKLTWGLPLMLCAAHLHAAVTTYTDRTSFNAAAGATRVIDFTTTDSGALITNPYADVHFPYLGLSGVCFQDVRSYYDLLVYTFPNATITAGLPQNTYAAGSDWFPWYAAANILKVRVSSGGVVHEFVRTNPSAAWETTFFGVISDTPIEWISFTLDNAYIGMDAFTVNATAGAGRGCPAPADTTGPVTSNVTLAPNPVAVNTPVALTAAIDDTTTGGSNIAGAQYSIASGAFTAMAGSFNTSPAVNVSATIPGIAAAGVYSVCVQGSDSAGNVGQLQCGPLPVYDPSAGFVTGGGWITSLPGAFALDLTLGGKATFGFVSKYQNGASVPTGNTQFVFHAANMNFHSTAYDWLVIAGARAQYKGSGSINGQPGYSFLLAAIDGNLPGGGGADRFRLKIWAAGGVVYDNEPGSDDNGDPATALGGGSIIIHKK